jgi:hypothetical protein
MDRVSGRDCLCVRGPVPSLFVEMGGLRKRALKDGRWSPRRRPLEYKTQEYLFRLAKEIAKAVKFVNYTVRSSVILAFRLFTI